MARLVRLLRLVRAMTMFDSLFVLTKSLQSSVSATSWAIVLLCFLQAVTGFLIGFLMVPYIEDTSNPLEKRMQVYKYFGTSTRAFLTMFEMTFGNFMVPTRVATEHVSEWYMPLFLLHKLII